MGSAFLTSRGVSGRMAGTARAHAQRVRIAPTESGSTRTHTAKRSFSHARPQGAARLALMHRRASCWLTQADSEEFLGKFLEIEAHRTVFSPMNVNLAFDLGGDWDGDRRSPDIPIGHRPSICNLHLPGLAHAPGHERSATARPIWFNVARTWRPHPGHPLGLATATRAGRSPGLRVIARDAPSRNGVAAVPVAGSSLLCLPSALRSPPTVAGTAADLG